MLKNKDSVEITVTAGGVRNGYLRLPPNGFSGAIKDRLSQDDVELDLEGYGLVDGHIDHKRNMFRWRGWKKFYELHKLKDGDRVEMTCAGRKRLSVSPIRVTLFDDKTDVHPQKHNDKRNGTKVRKRHASDKKCNELDGATWLQYSLSVWGDIRKTPDELKLGHPAMFPATLAERLIAAFLRPGHRVVLDPFAGTGSTLVAARDCGKHGLGIELSPDYVGLAERRLDQGSLGGNAGGSYELRKGDANELLEKIESNSVDLCITSPPYWDILNQRRSADGKDTRHYGNLAGDLGTIASYDEFISSLGQIFSKVLRVLKPKTYCCVVVMDLRKQSKFFSLHADLSKELELRGFEFDDLIIWHRGHEYNNLRPLGYPYRFRINKIHEYILIFRKTEQPS